VDIAGSIGNFDADLNILSFDVEEIFHGEFTRNLSGVERKYRSEENIVKIIDLLQEHGTKATFFLVGECITDDGILSELSRKGHEIAFHTQDHIPLWEKTESSFRAELAAFKRRVFESTGSDCVGFRAPSFSLDRTTSWAIECLAKEGYKYDSSVFPVRGPLYGLPSAPLTSYEISKFDPAIEGDSGVIEFPLTVVQLFGLRIPVAGGFYLRAIPQPIMKWLLKRALEANGSLIIYSHNWEVDARVGHFPLPPLADFYCYFNIKSTYVKLRSLLEKYRFVRFTDALQWRLHGH
jgi:peptidoglycan-N-acetylglucosamine deacetylase